MGKTVQVGRATFSNNGRPFRVLNTQTLMKPKRLNVYSHMPIITIQTGLLSRTPHNNIYIYPPNTQREYNVVLLQRENNLPATLPQRKITTLECNVPMLQNNMFTLYIKN